MIGSVIGDVVGSRFEFDNHKSKEFELFDKNCFFTDDTVCTMAVLKTLLEFKDVAHFYTDFDELNKYQNRLVYNLKDFVRRYPDRGYGLAFERWVKSDSTSPYYSCGNGSAMRISPVAWISKSLNEVKFLSSYTSSVTHNHPSGIKGAEAIAVSIFLARAGKSKLIIKDYIYNNYYPILNYLDYKELVKNNEYYEPCEDTVPLAIYCFLISNSLEDTIRTAVSIGGDSDTIACMAASIAEAYYDDEKTRELKKEFFKNEYLPIEFIRLYKSFAECKSRRTRI